jgi:hypothetical protein
MQEFSSVTASSYDAESLAPMLNDKAVDGWSVVSIVAAGTNIVAYLQREAGGHVGTAAPAAEEVLVAESMQDARADETPAHDQGPADEMSADDESPFIPAADESPAPVDEPAGWAAAPDDQTTEVSAEELSIAALAAEVREPEPESVAEPAGESTVPAGWYADPSGRFELRYWDGTAWTEHVSRAGQQFTDPPVA